MERQIDAFDRSIVLIVGDEVDDAGQFRVSVEVDGKARWAAYFTDKTDHGGERAETDALYAFQKRVGRWPNVDEQTAIREELQRGS
jgi:hypothetical protein